jgi:hypothetical protein
MKPPSHIVVRRPFADDPDRDEEPRWEKIGFAPSLAAAKRLALNPVDEDGQPIALSPGDLLLATRVGDVNPLRLVEHARHLFVVAKDGAVVAAPSVLKLLGGAKKTWLWVWEGDGADAVNMVDAGAVSTRETVLIAVDCVRPEVENSWYDLDEAHASLAIAEAWGKGKTDWDRPGEERAAALRTVSQAYTTNVTAGHAAYLAGMAALRNNEADAVAAIRSAGVALAARTKVDRFQAGRDLAAIVRRRLPLGVVLMALAAVELLFHPKKSNRR